MRFFSHRQTDEHKHSCIDFIDHTKRKVRGDRLQVAVAFRKEEPFQAPALQGAQQTRQLRFHDYINFSSRWSFGDFVDVERYDDCELLRLRPQVLLGGCQEPKSAAEDDWSGEEDKILSLLVVIGLTPGMRSRKRERRWWWWWSWKGGFDIFITFASLDFWICFKSLEFFFYSNERTNIN